MERQEGWYWVQIQVGTLWRPAWWSGVLKSFDIWRCDGCFLEHHIATVGPYIQSPAEPVQQAAPCHHEVWQWVPDPSKSTLGWWKCSKCPATFHKTVQQAAPETPVTPQELRIRARLIREGWTFYEAPQIAAELDELADWMARNVK